MSELRWQREPPDSPGDWLWVRMERELLLDVGVCRELGKDPDLSQNLLPAATAWAKIELPPREWAENQGLRKK